MDATGQLLEDVQERLAALERPTPPKKPSLPSSPGQKILLAVVLFFVLGALGLIAETYRTANEIKQTLAAYSERLVAIEDRLTGLEGRYNRGGARADSSDIMVVLDCTQQMLLWHQRGEWGNSEENERCVERMETLYNKLQARISAEAE